jgi:hypothetical protein
MSDQMAQAAEMICAGMYWQSLTLLALSLLKSLEDEIFGAMKV